MNVLELRERIFDQLEMMVGYNRETIERIHKDMNVGVVGTYILVTLMFGLILLTMNVSLYTIKLIALLGLTYGAFVLLTTWGICNGSVKEIKSKYAGTIHKMVRIRFANVVDKIIPLLELYRKYDGLVKSLLNYKDIGKHTEKEILEAQMKKEELREKIKEIIYNEEGLTKGEKDLLYQVVFSI